MMHTLGDAGRAVNRDEHTANLLGALATALCDEMTRAATAVMGHGPSHAAALASIAERPGSSVGELALVVGKSHSATVRIVDQLEADGLVRRAASAGDARRVEIDLTSVGAERVAALHRARLSALCRHLGSLAPSARRTFGELLDEMLSTIAPRRAAARQVCRFCDHGICRGRDCPVGRPFLEEATAR